MRSPVLFVIVPSTLLIFAAAWAATAKPSSQSAAAVAPAPQKQAAASKNPATLVQLMRGTLFIDSNIIYAAQGKNPADIPPAKRPSAATDPLQSNYGQWEAVENSSLAIVETANLLTVPTRVCSNGRPVPTSNPDWPQLVQGLRDAGMKSYIAAQSKDQDKIADAADVLTTACSNCHVKYRDKEKLADRCQK